ncbi:TnsA endonuclease C-terminal domain-containing protein [Paenibacillus pseudetheri]|uniref:Transposon Tn7 transposition protein TnsA n=1 Tax=Paenibacillus pseudetheri TaxID=2897682 RepID=A0ABM9BHL6_9BACL|nr:TnsA endonuclease C-terminal domain-containing protein [Paenibacillus pseudetheri]CAH1057603.1 Transposon Tn7 transposition protein TnsA [Paenibacillus pseudetheri]
MAKRKREWTDTKIKARIKKGKGQGFGVDYKPWLTIHDVPSSGVVTRMDSWTVGRIHHLMSIFERKYFYMVDWSDRITDIREQYPCLPLERTLEIADELVVKHHTDPKTNEPVVITTDFMLSEGSGQLYARTLKEAGDLSIRTVEKLTIEQRYYQEKGIDFKVVTDLDVPRAFVENIEWVHRSRFLKFAPSELSTSLIKTIAPELFLRIKQKMPLSIITIEFDEKLGLPIGTSMFIVQHMLATKQWKVDMYKKIYPSEIIEVYEADSSIIHQHDQFPEIG